MILGDSGVLCLRASAFYYFFLCFAGFLLGKSLKVRDVRREVEVSQPPLQSSALLLSMLKCIILTERIILYHCVSLAP